MKSVFITQLCPTLCDSKDCSPSGYSVHGILQARILEWVAIPLSRGSSDSGIELRSPTLRADSLPSEPPVKLSGSQLWLPIRVTWGASLVVQWLGLYASTADGVGGVTRVWSLIWELVSGTLLSVVKENRITWGTLKNSHSPHQTNKQTNKKTCSASHPEMSIVCQQGPDFFFFFFSRSPSDFNGRPEMGNISF